MKKIPIHTKLQDQIVAGLEAVEGQAKFKGRSGNVQAEEEHVIENGNVIEKGGVNISAVHKPIRCKKCSM
jgi:coproporphyrinogen III oxidase